VDFRRITLLGVGLVGGSFALALKKHNLCEHITGYGRNGDNLQRAKGRGIIDAYNTDPVLACKDADLVVFATPVGRFESLAAEVSGELNADAVVIDVGSIKGALVYRMEDLMPPGVRYVGCHPIAGGESSGIDSSSEGLFDGARCIITVTDNSDEDTIAIIAGLWKSMGCRVVRMDPEEHDRKYALVSHFPHLAAYALVSAAVEADTDSLDYAGRGFKDMTRVALSSPSMWREICMMNRANVIEAIESFEFHLDRLRGFLETGDVSGLEESFEKARALREEIGS
jgi:prephenate dehydrogenase